MRLGVDTGTMAPAPHLHPDPYPNGDTRADFKDFLDFRILRLFKIWFLVSIFWKIQGNSGENRGKSGKTVWRHNPKVLIDSSNRAKSGKSGI